MFMKISDYISMFEDFYDNQLITPLESGLYNSITPSCNLSSFSGFCSGFGRSDAYIYLQNTLKPDNDQLTYNAMDQKAVHNLLNTLEYLMAIETDLYTVSKKANDTNSDIQNGLTYLSIAANHATQPAAQSAILVIQSMLQAINHVVNQYQNSGAIPHSIMPSIQNQLLTAVEMVYNAVTATLNNYNK